MLLRTVLTSSWFARPTASKRGAIWKPRPSRHDHQKERTVKRGPHVLTAAHGHVARSYEGGTGKTPARGLAEGDALAFGRQPLTLLCSSLGSNTATDRALQGEMCGSQRGRVWANAGGSFTRGCASKQATAWPPTQMWSFPLFLPLSPLLPFSFSFIFPFPSPFSFPSLLSL